VNFLRKFTDSQKSPISDDGVQPFLSEVFHCRATSLSVGRDDSGLEHASRSGRTKWVRPYCIGSSPGDGV